MANELENPVLVEEEDLDQEDTLSERFMDWIRTELVWYAGSFTFHLLLISSIMLFGSPPPKIVQTDGTTFEGDAEKPPEQKADTDPVVQEKFDIGETPEDPTELNTDTLTTGQVEQQEEYNDDSEVFEHKGGGTPGVAKDAAGGSGFNVMAWGAGVKVTGKGGVGTGVGTGTSSGSGGNGTGFGGRGSGHRAAMLGRYGGTKLSERAVAGALHWLMRHQCYEGNWSFDKYNAQCKDATCTGGGSATADAGATGMALLCFLGAGQTHKTRGPYRMNIEKGLVWLVRHQERDGNLAKGCGLPMYSHGLATIALCEAFGLSGDRNVGTAAQGAVNFIIAAQNKNDNGWRYNPGDPGDTSVVGWQIMALKSAQMAGLNVGGSGGSGSIFDLAGKWLDLVKTGPNDSQFQYQPGSGATPTMSAAGLLCRQYLHAKRTDPMMVDGVKYLMQNLPDVKVHNVYYWYYATQVIHNYTGYEWDTWNRAMRKLLITTQTRSNNCANGSWDPENPSKDQWSPQGGRHMITALSCLTLEIYYRYLPLYKVDAEDNGAAGAVAAPAAKDAKGADAKGAAGKDSKDAKGAAGKDSKDKDSKDSKDAKKAVERAQ
ncbi:MAG: prenyltransferase/squalene oxidase repeat-containing protein [Thermoguttaceae bacterium]